MPTIGTMLESQGPDDWDAARRNQEITEKHLRPPLPNARVRHDAAQTLVTGTETTVLFNTERWDVSSIHSTAANTGRLTAPITGLYLIGAHITFQSNATGYRYGYFRVNGTTYIAGDERPAVNGDVTAFSITTLYRMARDDYVELRAWQNSGGNLNINASNNYSPEFWMVRLGGYTNEGVA